MPSTKKQTKTRRRHSPPPSITVVIGSSGSGKTAWTGQRVSGSRRLLVWDAVGDFWPRLPGVQCFSSRAQLVDAVLSAGRGGAGRFVFMPQTLDVFGWWCAVALAWGRCSVVAEELADVTSPGKAPDGWGQLVRRGRHAHIDLYAITQRPAESDKTVMGNATGYHVGFLRRPGDRLYMSKELGLPVEVLDNMQPLDYVDVFADGRISPVQKLTF